ncbi:iron-regulated transporter [Aspergillus ellipticus CBS 707.79]|uniref:Solute carrier family 40 member n=1 Tax=Aspergillus ellipticus CBS 707.79 TaxID=1448320 RepID=A0A319D1V7_9EURO|nr:iron-regulated transporter [Aspergillus ellipticus CBS 707.79]
MSAYALSRGLAAIIFAPVVGHYIDAGNRLQVVRVSIVVQRLVVATSCVIFYLLAVDIPITRLVKMSLLATLTLLACFEKLGSILNLVSVEKDWVVVVAGDDYEGLKTMNAQMRQIDLICKLIGPFFIALIDGISTEAAILVNLGMNVCSVVVEYFSIAKVYHETPSLQTPKHSPPKPQAINPPKPQTLFSRLRKPCHQALTHSLRDFTFYSTHQAFLPSFADSLLYLTVLSFAGQMVTWLLSAGYDSTQIAIARTLSVTFEVLATWIAPWLMSKIGPIRAGLWLAGWQIACLAGGIAIFWRFASHPLLSASGLVGGTILSRVGLRGFDLCIQILVQEGVEPDARGSFSSTEAAWQSLFEICSYTSTMVFSRPDQFKWPALISVVAVGLAGVLYAVFVRIQRGHLVHLPKLFALERLQRFRERGLDRLSEASDI